VSQYKITNEELIDFARRIYEEACCGYLDLKDSVCDRMVRDFIDGRQIISGMQPLDPVMIENYPHQHYAGPENNPASWTYTDPAYAHIQVVSTGNTISLRDEPSVSPRSQDIVRIEDNLRTNYEGNESERF